MPVMVQMLYRYRGNKHFKSLNILERVIDKYRLNMYVKSDEFHAYTYAVNEAKLVTQSKNACRCTTSLEMALTYHSSRS